MAKTTLLSNGDWLNMVFDAASDQVFRFTYGGNQVVKNRLVIRNNATNEEVYNYQIESMRLEHLLPASTLANGVVYNARIIATYRNADGTMEDDEPSNMILVECYSTPIVYFENLEHGGTISNSSYDLSFHYIQAESNLANRYILRLYNSGRHEIWNSGAKYPGLIQGEFSLVEAIRNLQDAQQYYVSCEVEAVCGLTGSTGLIAFYVQYLKPASYSTMYLENAPDQYAIKVISNIKVVNGIIDGPEPKYIDNTIIDLADGKTTVSWIDMGRVSSDFQLILEVQHGAEIYRDILELTDESSRIYAKIMRGILYGQTEEKLYALLYSDVAGLRYTIISNLIPIPRPGERYCVSVLKKGWYFSVDILEEVPT